VVRGVAIFSVTLLSGLSPVSGQEPTRLDSIPKPDSISVRSEGLIHILPELQARVPRSSLHRVYTLKGGRASLFGETLADWVRILPGVQVRGRGSGGAEVVTIRGSRAHDVRITLDGVPLANPLTGVIDLSTMPSSSIEMLELMPGAGATAGSGGTGGTIELKSRDPRPGVSVRGVVGSLGRRASDVELGWEGYIGSLGIYGSTERVDNDYAFRNRIAPNHPMERRTNADRASRHVVARGRLRVIPIFIIARADAVDRGTPGRMGNYVWDAARWNERRSLVSATWRSQSGRRISLAWSKASTQYKDGRVGRSEDLAVEHMVSTGQIKLLAETDVRWEGTFARAHGDRLSRETRWTAGVRVSRSDAIGSAITVLSAIKVDIAREGVAVLPAVGIQASLEPGWTVHGRASQARRLPTLADLFLQPMMGALPNPTLTPEYVELDSEVGITWKKQKVELRTSLFRRSTRDPIVWLPSVVGIWSPRNLATLNAKGLEFAGVWEPLDRWNVRLAGTWQNSRVTFDNATSTPLPYEPGLSSSLAVYYQGEERGVSADITVTGSRRTNIFGPHKLPGYALVNIRGRQTFQLLGMRAQLEAGMLNALGSVYERMELFPEPGRRLEVGLRILTGSLTRLPGTPSYKTLNEHAPGRSRSVEEETKRW
jgi:outer membrane receptor protein involved in Fe transport